MKKVAKEYDLERNIKYNSKLIGAAWNEETARWRLQVKIDGQEIDDECDILVNAAGALKYAIFPLF